VGSYSKTMQKLLALAVFFIFVFSAVVPVNGYYVTYKEQYYRLYHLHHIQYPNDSMENIYWLEHAVKADFANPLHAFALIENETQWEKYRYLFNMHIQLKLIEQYLFLGNKFNKRNAYFFNAPWKEQNLKSLETAESCYRTALYYWTDAVDWAMKARERRFYFITLPRVQNWEDEAMRVETGNLITVKLLTANLPCCKMCAKLSRQWTKIPISTTMPAIT